MHNTATLIKGFTTYADASELVGVTADMAPGISPVSVFLSASSPECVMFTIGVSSGAVTSAAATFTVGC